MKKFLSLVLALVMTMSLVTVSAGAKDFTDNSKINYAEAVDVMSAVKVIDGYADGSFNPSATLTRGAAAKIICNMILGPTTASALVADAAPYKDVPTNHTFAGYIAYCQKTGIISGYADGTFKPANTLTGYAFMKMLLGALGYDAANEGYNSPNWSIAVAKQAINAGLNKGLTGSFNGVKAVNREEACLYAFNTLKATMVEYTTQTIVVNNGSVSTDKTAKAMEWVGVEKAYDGDKDGKVQFAEKYFEKLTAKYDTDDFERPVTTWSNDKKEIGTYVRKDLLVEEYKGVEVTGADLYNLLGKSVVDDYDFNVAIDGITDSKIDSKVFNKTNINKNNKKAIGGTDTGVLTQVFQDTDEKEVYIAVINTYLAQATKDYDTKKESAPFEVFALKEVPSGSDKEYVRVYDSRDNATNDSEKVTVSNDDVNVESVKEDGFYLVTVAKHEIKSVEAAKIVSDTEISSFKQNSNVNAAGTKYDYAATAEYNYEVLDNYDKNNMKDTTYNIILDTYGNLIGVEKVDETDNYVFITGVDQNSSNLSKKNWDATAIFTDGTCKTITFKSDENSVDTKLATIAGTSNSYALINTWFTYTTDKDGVYTLKIVADKIAGKDKVAQSHDTTSTVIDKKNIGLKGSATYAGVYGNNATIYLTTELKQINPQDVPAKKTVIISDVDSVTTGVKNASIDLWKDLAAVKSHGYSSADYAASGAYVLYKDNGYVIAAVVVGEDGEASKNLVYFDNDKLTSESYDKAADEWTWTREAIYNGEKITLTEVGSTLKYLDKPGKYSWYQVKYNGKGEVVGIANESTPWTLTTATHATDKTKAGDYVKDIAFLNNAINNSKDTVLYAGVDLTAAKMKGNTLYLDKALTKGFYVDEDAKVVFIQENDGKKTTEFAAGADEVQGFIDDLNADKTGAYKFDVSAILENGVAKTVIIRDQIDATYKKGEATKPSTTEGIPATTITGLTINVALVNGEATTAYEKAVAKLESEGYKVEGVKVIAGGEYEISASKGSVTGYTFTTATTMYYKVTVKAVSGKDWTFDGKSELEVYLANSKASDEIALSDSTNTGFTGWKAITSTTGFTVTSNKSTDTTKVTFKLTATGLTDDSAVVEIDITNV